MYETPSQLDRNKELLPNLASVLYLPPMPASLTYRSYLDNIGSISLLEWFIQNFAEAYPKARLFILFDNETDEVAFRSISACRRVTLHRTKHKTKLRAFAEVAEKFGEADLAIFGLGIAFAPNDLLAKAYSHHGVMNNAYTEVVGLSDGAAAEIYSSDLLFYLLRLQKRIWDFGGCQGYPNDCPFCTE